MRKKPQSARGHKANWRNEVPPKESRVLISNALIVAGNAPALAKFMGITRSSIYQWLPPYRESPYMPTKMAERLLEDPVFRSELEELND